MRCTLCYIPGTAVGGLSLRYLFEDYALDTDRRELHRGADVLPVAPQVFDLIEYLVRYRERVVSKDDLINAIWKGRAVSDAALTTRLNVARVAIGDTGEQQRLIKTLPRRGFRFVGQVRETEGPFNAEAAPALRGKPSIAVLPFQNLNDDPEQEYFADGLVEDITMALSRFRWLVVVDRSSSFAYKGRAVDVKQLGRELGVRYVLEGSVRKAGNRIRIAGQLIDAETGAHLWADRIEGTLLDVFDLQDYVTSGVVSAITPKLQIAAIKRAKHKPTKNLDAYDYYLRGLARSHRWTNKGLAGNDEALELFRKAIALDTNLASAYGMAAWCYVVRKARGWMIERTQESAEAKRLAWKAVQLGGDDAVALGLGGYALAFVANEFDDATNVIDRALVVNPNLAQAWRLSSWLRVWRGEPDLALDHLAQAERLSPIDQSRFDMLGATAYAHFLAGRYDVALSYADKSVRDNPTFLLSVCSLAACSALAGRPEQARSALVQALECSPNLRASNLKDLISFRGATDLAKFVDGLRKAGLPE